MYADARVRRDHNKWARLVLRAMRLARALFGLQGACSPSSCLSCSAVSGMACAWHVVTTLAFHVRMGQSALVSYEGGSLSVFVMAHDTTTRVEA